MALARYLVHHRPYYGWYIVLLAFLGIFVSMSLRQTILSVLFKPMILELDWTRTTFSLIISVGLVIGGFSSLVIGPLMDRYGGRWLMPLGGIIIALSTMALSQVNSIWQFFLFQSILISIGIYLIGHLVVNTAISNWFIRKRGRAIAFGAMGLSTSAIIIPPLTQMLADGFGWRYAWAILGPFLGVIIIVPALLFMRQRPEEIGLKPDGEASSSSTGAIAKPPPEEVRWTRNEVMRQPTFWLLVASGGFLQMCTGAINLHIIPHLTDVGISPIMATSIVSVWGIASLSIKPVWGFLTERVPVRYCAAIAYATDAVAILLLISTRHPALLYVINFIRGLGTGGFTTVGEMLWANYYGRLSLGRVRSIALPFSILFSAIGPVFAGYAFDLTGNYRSAFGTLTATVFLSTFLVLLTRPPRKAMPPG